jgi:hypothetical protein
MAPSRMPAAFSHAPSAVTGQHVPTRTMAIVTPLPFRIRLVEPNRDLQAFVGFLKVIDVQGHQLTAPAGSAETEQQPRPVTLALVRNDAGLGRPRNVVALLVDMVPARLLLGTEKWRPSGLACHRTGVGQR